MFFLNFFENLFLGTFESIMSINEENQAKQGIDKLVRVEQWGTTELKTVGLMECTNLTQLATPTENSFKDLEYVTFAGSGVTSIPDKLFANCNNIKSFEGAFANCSNLISIGNYAFAGCSSVTSFDGNFLGCSNLTTIGDYAFANCSNVISFDKTFSGCSNLETIGDYAFANCSSVTSFDGNFLGCSNLTTIGEHIFEGCESVESYKATFNACYNLTGKAPELWLKVPNGEENGYVGIPDGESCFGGCTKLDNYEDIPEYWSKVGVPG